MYSHQSVAERVSPSLPNVGGSEASLHRHSRTCSGHHQHRATTAHGLIVQIDADDGVGT